LNNKNGKRIEIVFSDGNKSYPRRIDALTSLWFFVENNDVMFT
jgi:hypothetical protein